MKNKIITVLIVLILFTATFNVRMVLQSNSILPTVYTQEEIAMANDYFYTSFVASPAKSQQVTDIENLYGNLNITYKSLKDYGLSYPVFQKIYLDYEIPLNRFARCLAHEAEHLNFEYREYMADYKAIIRLYESGIPYLKYQAYIGVLDAFNNRLGDVYNCTNLLVEYYLANAN
jgi:hypothetical protein